MSWYGGDWVSKEITAIAWAWVDHDNIAEPMLGENGVECEMHTGSEASLRRMLKRFVDAYNAADIVTGHYIRGFDLPLVNGALVELGMPPLKAKLTQDTKIDLMRFSGHSKSQENLGAMLGLEHPKVGMSQADWRAANRLTRDGRERTMGRVVGDVVQHIEMRAALIERGMLKAPTVWSSGAAHGEKYHP